jgi:hypothetical protein
MKCIFCDNENEAKSSEHIVPESFGNTFYILPKGVVCDSCNNSFSTFESKALTDSVFVFERARFSVPSKKRKGAKGKVNELIIEADEKFRKGHLFIKGLNNENVKNFDAHTQSFKLVVSAFDKSEVAASKLFLSMGMEAIYQSQGNLYDKYSFNELKEFITKKDNTDWPFISTDFETDKFKSIPTYYDKYRLKKIYCSLSYLEVDDKTLLFKFKYGGIAMTINLLNRDYQWMELFYKRDKSSCIFPRHFERKFLKKVKKK